MTPSYFVRLLLLSGAAFFIVRMVAEALAAVLAPSVLRRADNMQPRRAARVLLSLRLLPGAISAIAVALCVPSYLRFEPQMPAEQAGIACLAAAILGAAICVLAIFRSFSALVRSTLHLRRAGGRESSIEGESVWIVGHSAGLALAGILRPRLLISERALAGLSPEELAVALRHEQAHRTSRDNLKRLLILLAPSPFPAMRTLEEAWARDAEWAADDRATAGDAGRSASLASALVRVARLQLAVGMPPLVTPLVAQGEDLSLRVDRLLSPSGARESGSRLAAIALALAAVLIASLAMNLRVVHLLLESLLD